MKKLKDKVKGIMSDKTKRKQFIGLMLGTFLLLGLSLAYMGPLISDIVKTNISGTGTQIDQLIFSEGDTLSLTPGTDNLNYDDGNYTVSTLVSATIIANEITNKSTMYYSMYIDITENDYVYTTEDNTPELILTIIDPDGNEITSIEGLTYYENTNGLSGFDVTTSTGLLKIVEDYSIYGNPTSTDEWTVKISMANLETDQGLNAMKTFAGTIDFSEEMYPETPTYYEIASTASGFTINTVDAINTECTDEDISYSWNYKYNSLDITSMSGETYCTITKEDNTSSEYGENISDYIMSQVGTYTGYSIVHETDTATTSTGQTVEVGYRYEGTDPNNYVWFNGELWQIIGVMETTLSDGTTTEMLTKLIATDDIGGWAWDSASTNDWPNSSLYKILNTDYYGATDGSSSSSYCYKYSTLITGDCDFTDSGIQYGYRSMIENVTWYLGGTASASYASAFFTAERGTTVYSGRSTSTTGYIGLMYMSDYGYSVLSSSCSRTTSVGSYSTDACAGNSWMYYGNYIWTIVPYSSSSNYAWYVSYSGTASYSSSYYAYGALPVLYLKSEVEIVSGEGTASNPYILSM